MTNFIGPAVPPHLAGGAPSSEEDEGSNGPQMPHLSRITSVTHSENSTDETIGPLLPPHLRRETEDSEASNDEIGPALPKHLRCPESREERHTDPSRLPSTGTKLGRTLSKESGSSDEEASMIGPFLPPHLQDSLNEPSVGPKIPPLICGRGERTMDSSSSSSVGPSLPAHLKQRLLEEAPTVVEDEASNEERVGPVIGPTLPAHLKIGDVSSEEDEEAMYGPALPPGLKPKTVVVEKIPTKEEDSDDEALGPLPDGVESAVQKRLELRAQHLRLAMASGETTEDAPQKRESWMLELPESRAPELGLKPRQFRKREGPESGDRSVWTDTPEDRERKKRNPKTISPDRGLLQRQAVRERDEMMEKMAKKHSSKRGTRSLVDLHQEKLEAKKKKEEKEGQVAERRPFSREVDLQVNRFDDAQKKSILKKAQHLNDRFSAGASKFL